MDDLDATEISKSILNTLEEFEHKLVEHEELIIFNKLLPDKKMQIQALCFETLLDIAKSALQCGNIRRALYYQIIMNKVLDNLCSECNVLKEALTKKLHCK